MQGDKTMLKLASSLGFMYRILFFASVTDTSTLMAWNIRQSKDDAFSSNFLYLWHIFLLRGRIPMCQDGNTGFSVYVACHVIPWYASHKPWQLLAWLVEFALPIETSLTCTWLEAFGLWCCSFWGSRDIRGQQCRAWWRWCPYDSQIPRNDALHNSFMWHSYGRRELWEQGCKGVGRIRACTWPYRGRYLTTESPLAQLFLLR